MNCGLGYDFVGTILFFCLMFFVLGRIWPRKNWDVIEKKYHD